MKRLNGGGIFGLMLLFVQSVAMGQSMMLVSGKDGRPVRDALVLFSGQNQEQFTSISDPDGRVNLPSFRASMLMIRAAGFQTILDTLHGSLPQVYSLKPLEVDMKEVVITGQYHPNESSNSVYEVKVFDARSMEMRAANNLSDLLLQENSILISRDPFLGAGLNINGISGNNVKILQDGVPVIGRENGNIDISQLDLTQVERVELVRGPMSETYGSDALAGVINLISKKRNTDGVDAGLRAYYESIGTYNFHVQTALRKRKQEYSLHIGRNFFDGYSEFDTLRSKQWKPKEQYLLDAAYTYRFKSGYVRYLGNVARELLISKGNIIATPYEAYAFDDYYNTFRMSHKLFTDLSAGKHASVNLTNAFSNYERSRLSYRKDMVLLKQTGIPSNEYTNLFRQFLFRGTWSTFRSWKKINYQAGYDITLDEARGDRTGSATRHINDFAVFGSAEFAPAKAVLIRPALRVIYNTRYPAPLVPSLHVKVDPVQRLTLRASVARGFRAPSVKELYLDFEDSNHNLHGNTSLKPELSDYAQLDAEWRQPVKSVDLSLQPGVFINHIYHKIALAQLDNNSLEYTYINMDDFRNYGGNLNLSVDWKSVRVSPGVQLTAIHHDFAGQDGRPGYTNTVNYNGALTWKPSRSGFSAGLFFKHTGRSTVYSLENEQVATYTIKAYTTMDLTAGKSFFSGNLRLSGGVKNLFNVTTSRGLGTDSDVHGSEQNEALVSPGRYFYAGIQYTLDKSKTK